MKTRNLLIVFCAVIACAFMLSGCKVTGGGWIESTECDGKANFGFVAMMDDSCIPFIYTGKFNYHDKNAGLKMNGDVEWGDAGLLGGWQCFGGTYRSTNPKDPGDGSWCACVKDRGEGINEYGDGDEIKVWAYGGPYDGYYNRGYVQGNIQDHE